MADFEYIARANSGQRVTGTLTAPSEKDVLTILAEKGYMPVRIAPSTKAKRTIPLLRKSGRVSGRSMSRIYRQLADLLKAGVPLLRGIELMEKQSTEQPLIFALSEVRKSVADGEGLAESLAKHPLVFNELAVSMVRAGQEGGFLEDVLARIADYTEQEEELKGRVLGALAYPIFLFVVGSIVITVLLVFFVPKFEPVFERLKAKGQLPGITQALLGTSSFIQRFGIVIVVALVAGFFLFERWRRTPVGREKFDAFQLKIPVLGAILRDFAIVRFARVLGTLLANGIPLLQALRISKDSCGNIVMSRAVTSAADNVTSGASLTDPLRASGHFPRDMIEMVSIAEESNTLEKVLVDLANSTERRTSRQLELFVKLLEPMMLLVMASITLVVVSGLLLPVMKMSSALR